MVKAEPPFLKLIEQVNSPSGGHLLRMSLICGAETVEVTREESAVCEFITNTSGESNVSGPAAIHTALSELLTGQLTLLPTLAFLENASSPLSCIHSQHIANQINALQSSMASVDARLEGLEAQLAMSVGLLERLWEQEKTTSVGEAKDGGWKTSLSVEALPVMDFMCDASLHPSDASVGSATSDLSNSVADDHDGLITNNLTLMSNAQQQAHQLLCNDLIALEGGASRFFEEVRPLIDDLLPGPMRAKRVQAALNFVRKQARLSINCSFVETSLHELGCGLPDEPLQISLLLSRTHFPAWHTALSEALAMYMDAPREPSPRGSEPDSESGESRQPAEGPPKVARVDGIKWFKAADGSVRVHFNVNALAFQITSNRRTDLCFVAFLDEMNLLVGRDSLFKRTMLLIRAWWAYCSSAFVGQREIAHYLPADLLCLMVCMVFNLHHSRISSPLQAFVLFLAEFCAMDTNHHVVTLQGLVLHASHRGPLTLLPVAPYHLLGHATLEKYWQLFNMGGSQRPGAQVYSSQMGSAPEFSAGYSAYNPYASRTRLGFERRGFNALHPFTHQPMALKRVPSLRSQLIMQAFRGCAAAMKRALVPSSGRDLSRTVFVGLRERVLAMPRDAPDSIMPERDPLDDRAMNYNSTDRIWQNILFANFVLESVVSESAILTATVEALAIKGPLPVGEVGKILTEVSGMQQLSLHVKEKFGGLKKFLEKFTELFVFSNDHPFNPHVLLRSVLGAEYQKMIYRGVIPMQIMVLFKKSAGGKRSKAMNALVAASNAAHAHAQGHAQGQGQSGTFVGLNVDKIQAFVPRDVVHVTPPLPPASSPTSFSLHQPSATCSSSRGAPQGDYLRQRALLGTHDAGTSGSPTNSSLGTFRSDAGPFPPSPPLSAPLRGSGPPGLGSDSGLFDGLGARSTSGQLGGRGQGQGFSQNYGQSYDQNFGQSYGQGYGLSQSQSYGQDQRYGQGQSYGQGLAQGQGYSQSSGHGQGQAYGSAGYSQARAASSSSLYPNGANYVSQPSY